MRWKLSRHGAGVDLHVGLRIARLFNDHEFSGLVMDVRGLVGGQTLTTQPGDSGSCSLGQVHNLAREDIERSDGRQLAATIRRDLVIPIVTLDHGSRMA